MPTLYKVTGNLIQGELHDVFTAETLSAAITAAYAGESLSPDMRDRVYSELLDNGVSRAFFAFTVYLVEE